MYNWKQRINSSIILVILSLLVISPITSKPVLAQSEGNGEIVNLLQNHSFEGDWLNCFVREESYGYVCGESGRFVQEVMYPAGWDYWWNLSGGQPETRGIGDPYDYRVSEGDTAFLNFCPYRPFGVSMSQRFEIENRGIVQGCIDYHSWLFTSRTADEEPFMLDGRPLSMGCNANNTDNCGWGAVGCVNVTIIGESDSIIEQERCEESPDYYRTICTEPVVVPGNSVIIYTASGYTRFGHTNSDLYFDNAGLYYREITADWGEQDSEELILLTPTPTLQFGNNPEYTATPNSTNPAPTPQSNNTEIPTVETPTPTPTPTPTSPSSSNTPVQVTPVNTESGEGESETIINVSYTPFKQEYDASGRYAVGYHGFAVRQNAVIPEVVIPESIVVDDSEDGDLSDGDVNTGALIQLVLVLGIGGSAYFLTLDNPTSKSLREKLKLKELASKIKM